MTCAHTLLGPNVLQYSVQFSKLVTLDEAHVLCFGKYEAGNPLPNLRPAFFGSTNHRAPFDFFSTDRQKTDRQTDRHTECSFMYIDWNLYDKHFVFCEIHNKYSVHGEQFLLCDIYVIYITILMYLVKQVPSPDAMVLAEASRVQLEN